MSLALLLIALAVLAKGIAVTRALRRIPALAEQPLPVMSDAALPSISIACAGRDEAASWERAIRSWLRQDLPRLEVIVVDDRSSDGSLAILRRLAAEDRRLTVLRVEQRPGGWLGKCHALREAAARATGDYILFTDADVRLEDGALRRAAAFASAHAVDHLVLLPEVEVDSQLQRAFTITFFHELLLAARSDRANADDGACFLGVGAFNMVRRSVYEAAGGHEPIRMQVGDDVALARLMQRAGARHRVLGGPGVVRLRWHAGVLGTMRGLEKNAFWGARLSVPVVMALSALGLGSLLPIAGAFTFVGTGSPIGLAAFLVWLIGVALPHLPWAFAPGTGVAARQGSWLCIPAHPLSMLLLVATLWNSTLRVLHRGGIDWRGDFFPLEELRRGLKPLRWWSG